MTDLCASPKLHDRFKDIRTPLSRDILYHEYGITDHATEYSNQRPFYYLSSDHWLEQVPSENFSDTLYDSTNDKYFIKDFFNSDDVNDLSSWFTIHQLASSLYKHDQATLTQFSGVSPTNKPSHPIFRISDGIQVEAIQYVYQNDTYYYIRPTEIDDAHRGWHTESQLWQLGYTLSPNYFGLIYNIGLNTTSHISIGDVQ